MAKGVSAKLMRKLYLSVAVPKFTYGAGIWFRPTFIEGANHSQKGSIGIAKNLARIQRMATISITGAMRTTATDTLDAHAHLLPVTLLLQKTCHQAALRLSSLPRHHPLFKHLQHIAKHAGISRHRTSIHNLIATFHTFPDEIETVDTIHRPKNLGSIAYEPHIAIDKAKAIREHNDLRDEIMIYTDGSAHDGGVGAAAILYRTGKEPRALTFHLGSDKHHTVYEAEIVGLTLAAKLLMSEAQLTSPVSILIDNKAAIQSGASSLTTAGSYYLIDKFIRMTRIIKNTCKAQDIDLQLTVRWIPGHAGIPGNEEADEKAKKAAEGRRHSSPSEELPRYLRHGPLPHSISALKQWHQKALMDRWKDQWKLSPRYARAKIIDASMPSDKFLKLIDTLPKNQTSIYTQLRTRHVPLNHHLHRIGKSDTPYCAACPGKDETIYHYLFDCPQYARERHILANALRRKATSIGYILTSDKATRPLMQYINGSARFKPVLGEIPID